VNVTAEEIAQLKNFDDLRSFGRDEEILFSLSRRTRSTLSAAQSDRGCSRDRLFDAIEVCHFTWAHSIRIAGHDESHPGWQPLIATSMRIGCNAFWPHYTSMPMPSALRSRRFLPDLRNGPLRLTSPLRA